MAGLAFLAIVAVPCVVAYIRGMKYAHIRVFRRTHKSIYTRIVGHYVECKKRSL